LVCSFQNLDFFNLWFVFDITSLYHFNIVFHFLLRSLHLQVFHISRAEYSVTGDVTRSLRYVDSSSSLVAMTMRGSSSWRTPDVSVTDSSRTSSAPGSGRGSTVGMRCGSGSSVLKTTVALLPEVLRYWRTRWLGCTPKMTRNHLLILWAHHLLCRFIIYKVVYGKETKKDFLKCWIFLYFNVSPGVSLIKENNFYLVIFLWAFLPNLVKMWLVVFLKFISIHFVLTSSSTSSSSLSK